MHLGPPRDPPVSPRTGGAALRAGGDTYICFHNGFLFLNIKGGKIFPGKSELHLKTESLKIPAENFWYLEKCNYSFTNSLYIALAMSSSSILR